MIDNRRVKLIQEMEEEGWKVYRSKSRHWICKAPDKTTTIVLSGTPSDPRGIKNEEAKFRRWKAAQMKVFRCPECGKDFSSGQALSGHVRSHNPGVYPCEVCGKVFTQPNSIAIHRKSHKAKEEIQETLPLMPASIPTEDIPVPTEIIQQNGEVIVETPSEDSLGKIVEDLLAIAGRLDSFARAQSGNKELRKALLAVLDAI